jgi:uncharacterized membrane-anchored protein YitT (DUF2179 family)
MTVGIYFFKFPNNFSFGGVTGIAVLLAKLIPFTAGQINLAFNLLLLVLGYVFLGKGFAFKTVYVSLLNSGALWLLELLVPLEQPLTSQPMLELCFAIFLPAFGAALLFNMSASGGGTDIIALILKKYTSINIGTALLYTDALIVLFSFFVFDIQTALFSVLGLLAKSLVVDSVIENINLCKYFNVVCDDPKPICDYIVNRLGRSATICKGVGAFSGKDKYVVMTAMKRSQAVKLRNYIKKIEPTAFLLISSTSEIIGKGFRD